MGKNIQERFAHTYYNEIGLGIDFTARDIQNKCIEKGLPWEISKGFDGAAVVGQFFPKEKFSNLKDIDFALKQNGTIVQKGNSADMIFGFDALISYVSKFVTFKMGDIIFTGTPSGVGPVKINDTLEGFLAGEKAFKILVK
ncbi:MAG: Fumarylpyruvate hydrolase [Bacteroidetes bacterium ADurb.Bin408]|nr:MAG: Fumarylpyruvate hydrolase [Bacteroidetes bacterium ADurb.Bin408]